MGKLYCYPICDCVGASIVNPWPRDPVIYEINTWPWLVELSRRCKRPLTLETVPLEEWDALAELGIDAVWLMGIWERSPAGRQIALQIPELKTACRASLPDYSDEDMVGSPYSIRSYRTDEHLGGMEGLAKARSALRERGIRLILDFVPNHLARDHVWVTEHPDFFVQGDTDDLQQRPESFFKAGGKIFACGKDPHFPPWTDTVQLNAFHPQMREAAIETLRSISEYCDGVRCDMAMLMINRVFAHTWGNRAGRPPIIEYWDELIPAIRQLNEDFLFLAEAYWGLEAELLRQGFHYCYDKQLYDLLVSGTAEEIRHHLQAEVDFQEKSVRFLENHDEPRASVIFPFNKLRAVAFAVALLPGAKLIHEGQFEGRRIRLPVQLGRRREEEENQELGVFYKKLREVMQTAMIRSAEWRLCECIGWPDNKSFLNLIAWIWCCPEEQYIAAVNFSGSRSQARIPLPWPQPPPDKLRLIDLFSGEVYLREGKELVDPGLYVDLPPWGFHFLQCPMP